MTRLSRRIVTLLAVTSGASVANIYYVQPLLNLVADRFDVSDAAAGLLVTSSQIGFLIGLALLVPLGDLRERRSLISTMLLGAAAALAVCAAAPALPVLAVALVAVGAFSVVAQAVVPLASSLAGPQERGQVVGTVMSGLLIGILAARTLSGVVAEVGGWRLVFAIAAVAMLGLALLLRRVLPSVPPTERLGYGALLRSVLTLVAEEPVLRQRMALGALGMVGFAALWTSLAFLLGGPAYDYGSAVIGLFGLAGLAGAVAAPLAGRWADRGHGRLVQTGFLAAVPASWALLALGGHSLAALLAGIVLLDLGVQGAHIGNQSAIYVLRPEARSRLTTAYMVAVFLGGVAGSTLSAVVSGAGGWSATCVAGAGVAIAALALWAASLRVARPAAEAAERV
jgi:predicted MFS family arabinose efflux permease